MKFAALMILIFHALPAVAQVSDPQLAPRPSPMLVPPQPQGIQSPPVLGGPPGGQPAPKVEEARTILQGIFEDYKYDPAGKRDPFMKYAAPETQQANCGPFEDCDIGALTRFDLEQLKLVGIIWDVKTPKAMFVDPSNKTHVVNEQDKVGRNNGYIAEIREGELIVIEKFYNLGRFTYQTKVLRLQRD